MTRASPLLLLVATTAERGPPGYRPGRLPARPAVDTQAEIAERGPLEAPWPGSDPDERALPLADWPNLRGARDL